MQMDVQLLYQQRLQSRMHCLHQFLQHQFYVMEEQRILQFLQQEELHHILEQEFTM